MLRPALALFLATLATAQSAVETTPPRPEPFGPEEFRQRREATARALRAKHPNGRLVVLLRGAAKATDMGPFVQDQDFLWLSGVAEPELALLLVVGARGELERDELLVPPFSPFSATWDGRFLVPGDEAAKRTGFGAVGNVRSLHDALDTVLATDASGKRPLLFTATLPAARTGSTPRKAQESDAARAKDIYDGRASREKMLLHALGRQYTGLPVESLEAVVHALRPVKSAAEIAVLHQCSRIAAAGIAAAMRATEPGHYEYHVAAVARFTFTLHGAGPDAYAAIVGGGPNGCILHYNACDRQLLATDLIVMDYAPTLHGYATDVTRTFPASGKFSPEQRKLVQDVYEIQQELIADVKPGARLSTIGAKCAQMLVARGYRSDHGPCHHVGLAVHDPSVDELAAGMVITVEPGAYLRDKGMGCRIEDTILVTKDGNVVLSKDVPSTPDAIEALMAEPGLLPKPNAK